MRAVLALAILCAASSAHANPNEIFIGSATRALRSTSGDAVTGDTLGGGQVGYARELPLDLAPRLTLWAEGSFDTGFASGRMFDQFDTDVSSLGFLVGARAQYEVIRHVSVGARLSVGGARQKLSLSESESGMTASDARWGAVGTAAALVELSGLERHRVSVGLRFELAYTATQAVALHAKTDRGGDADMITLPARSEELGHLDLGGPSFSASIVTRF